MPNWLTSINQRLLVVFLLIALLPVATVGILNTLNTQRLLEDEVEDRQAELTLLTASQISAFVNDIQLDLQRIGLVALHHPENDYEILETQASSQQFFSEIRLANTEGQEVARIVDDELLPQDQLNNISPLEIFFRPMRDEIYFSSVRISGATPYIDIAVPVKSDNEIIGVIVAQITLEETWDVIQNQRIGTAGYTLLLDKRGNVIVLPKNFEQANTSFTTTPLLQAYIANPDEVSIVQYTSPISSETVLGSATTVVGPGWILVSERPTEEAFSAAVQSERNAYLGIGISVLLAIPLAFVLARQITRPIRILSQNAREIMRGNLTVHNTIHRRDEIGELATALNSMTSQLNLLINNLEERIADRTRDLQIAADVSRQTSTVLNLDELLPKLVELTRTSFDLYHVAVFFYDEETNLLTSAARTTGITSQGQVFDLSDEKQTGLIVRAARTRQVVNIGDVTTSPDYLALAELPLVRSELVLPLIVGDKIIGVLDLESKEPNRFSADDVKVMTTLAEQLAIAVQNAQLYAAQVDLTENLRAVDAMKSQFMASVSHELRTPLNAILNFTQFVISDIFGPINDEQRDALTKSLDSANHLLSLINDVLDITKIEAGMMVLFVENNVSIQRELDIVLSTTTSLLKDKPVQLVKEIDAELPRITADKRRIRQILLNLASNAAKFTEEGQVTIGAHVQDNEIHFMVKDTGPGIAPEDYDIIFESFRQARGGLEQGSGTGLGLAISKRLVEAHEGKLWFESQMGVGTTFYFTLPVTSQKLQEMVLV